MLVVYLETFAVAMFGEFSKVVSKPIDIVIELTLLSDIKYAVNGSTPTFDVYYNQNADYMVKNGALYSLFADEQY
mgnify:CR=1 FL=1